MRPRRQKLKLKQTNLRHAGRESPAQEHCWLFLRRSLPCPASANKRETSLTSKHLVMQAGTSSRTLRGVKQALHEPSPGARCICPRAIGDSGSSRASQRRSAAEAASPIGSPKGCHSKCFWHNRWHRQSMSDLTVADAMLRFASESATHDYTRGPHGNG